MVKFSLLSRRWLGIIPTALKPVEILYENPRESLPATIVLVCHPNPAAHGSMYHKIPTLIARHAQSTNFATLRFQFSGIGDTPGPFQSFEEEVELATCLIKSIQNVHPTVQWILTGFSFGGACALTMNTPGPRCLIAPAWSLIDPMHTPSHSALILQALDDEIVSVQSGLEKAKKILSPYSEWVLFPEGGHFLESQRDHLEYYLSLFFTHIDQYR